jgi:predicted short-subunit dehydrogenase-like oxidoreductase (DUF2520 family)
MLKLSVIGAGKLGKTLCRLFARDGVFAIGDILNRGLDSARAASAFIGSGRAIADWAQLETADVYMLAVPDDAIAPCAQKLAAREIVAPGSIAFHCSGSKPSSVLAALRTAATEIASLHPVKSFAEPAHAVATFPGTSCALEGDPRACAVLKEALERCGGHAFSIDADQKLVYHAGTVFVSNYLVSLCEVAFECFDRAGMSRDEARSIALPLLRGTIENIGRLGTADALTGPIARGDSALVIEQLRALLDWDRDIGELYARLGQYAVELSERRKSADAAALERIVEALRARSARKRAT